MHLLHLKVDSLSIVQCTRFNILSILTLYFVSIVYETRITSVCSELCMQCILINQKLSNDKHFGVTSRTLILNSTVYNVHCTLYIQAAQSWIDYQSLEFQSRLIKAASPPIFNANLLISDSMQHCSYQMMEQMNDELEIAMNN